MFKYSVWSLPVLLLAPAAFAATPTGADTLDYFVGDWHCHVQDTGGVADPNGFSTASTDRLRGDWFVTWVLAFYDGTSTKLVSQIRYDDARSEYVMFTQSDTGSYGMATTQDWQGDTLQFAGVMHAADGKDFKFTKTFTKIDGGSFEMGWQAEGQAAEAQLLCQK